MIKSSEFIPEVFLKLTSNTYPHGTEDIVADEMYRLGLFPMGVTKDVHGNYFYKIGKSRTIFASHLDTVSKEHTPVNHIIDGSMIKTDGTTTLGADDKAGVTILAWMIKNKIPGMYYFFIGEECGCIGSSAVAKYEDFKGKYDRIISFDRRDTSSIITHQSWSRCCSDSFADAFCDELNKSGMNYKKDDGGVYTDSAEFVGIIPECTNVSVGYYKEHSFNESQDIEHLIKLADACLLVEWEELPTKRNPDVLEEKSYKTYNSYSTYGGLVEEDWKGDIDKKSNKRSYNSGWTRSGTKVLTNKDYYSYNEDWYDEDEDGNYNKQYTDDEFYFKTPKKNKKPKTYIDKGDGALFQDHMLEINVTKHYDWVINKFSNSKITELELEIIREQYLDMDSDYDKFFYESLLSEI